MKPRSPPTFLLTSSDFSLATSSNALPPRISASAASASALAAAFCSSVGSVAPSVTSGLRTDDPAVAPLDGRGLAPEPLGDLVLGDGDAILRRKLLDELPVDHRLDRAVTETLPALVEEAQLGGRRLFADATGRLIGADLPLQVVEAEVLDGEPLAELVLVDSLAVDRRQVLEVVAPVGRARGTQQDQDAEEDDPTEEQVEVEVPPAARFERGSMRTPHGVSGSERHTEARTSTGM